MGSATSKCKSQRNFRHNFQRVLLEISNNSLVQLQVARRYIVKHNTMYLEIGVKDFEFPNHKLSPTNRQSHQHKSDATQMTNNHPLTGSHGNTKVTQPKWQTVTHQPATATPTGSLPIGIAHRRVLTPGVVVKKRRRHHRPALGAGPQPQLQHTGRPHE